MRYVSAVYRTGSYADRYADHTTTYYGGYCDRDTADCVTGFLATI